MPARTSTKFKQGRLPKLSRVERAVVRELYWRGTTESALGRLFGCSRNTIHNMVQNKLRDELDEDKGIIAGSDLSKDIIRMLASTSEEGNSTRTIPAHAHTLVTKRQQSSVAGDATEQLGTAESVDERVESTEEAEAEMPAPPPSYDDAARVRTLLATVSLGEDHVKMLLDEGIKSHQDLLFLKEIQGSDALESVKDTLRMRGFTTFELVKFISAVDKIRA